MILAIDPGITGALALYDPNVNFLVTQPLPTKWEIINGNKRSKIDLLALMEYLVPKSHLITEVILENPGPVPGQGVVSVFTFGKTCGQLEGLLRGMGFKVHLVAPSEWKKDLNVPSDKRRSRGRAQEFFPAQKAQFQLASSEGQAEAAMIALWCVERRPIKQAAKQADADKKAAKAELVKTQKSDAKAKAKKSHRATGRPVGRPKKNA